MSGTSIIAQIFVPLKGHNDVVMAKWLLDLSLVSENFSVLAFVFFTNI